MFVILYLGLASKLCLYNFLWWLIETTKKINNPNLQNVLKNGANYYRISI